MKMKQENSPRVNRVKTDDNDDNYNKDTEEGNIEGKT